MKSFRVALTNINPIELRIGKNAETKDGKARISFCLLINERIIVYQKIKMKT
jgi:hypothetical protein